MGTHSVTLIRVVLAWLAALVVTYALAAALSTQFVLARLADLDVDLSLTTRLLTTLQDIAGMAGMYLPLIAVALLVGFIVAALVVRWLLPGWQRLGYPLAGACAMVVLLATMEQVFAIAPVAGARSLFGLLMQGFAGAVGGLIFQRLAVPGSNRNAVA